MPNSIRASSKDDDNGAEKKIMSVRTTREKLSFTNVNELDIILYAISVIFVQHILTGTASEESGKVA